MAPGARSNFRALMFEPEVFRKQMCCTEVLVTLLGLFVAFIVIRRPGNCAPWPPSLRPWLLCSATRLNKSWYTALNRGIRELWDLGGEIFWILPNFCATVRKMNWRVLQGDGSSYETCPNISGSFSWIFLILCKSPPPLRTPIVLTQKLWQITSYLQLTALNNWFFVVITSFAQHLNICSPKLE